MTAVLQGDFIELDAAVLTWAKRYCDLGLRVLPLHGVRPDGSCTCGKGLECRSPGKHPKLPKWGQSATADYEKAKQLLDGSGSIGIATGRGICVLDVDGADGRASLAQLMSEHPDFPTGPVAETGSGGLHLFFRGDVSNGVKFLPGLDVRGEGGQVVACPSPHKSGRRYAWLPLDDGRPSIELPLPELPEWLAELMRGDRAADWDAKAWLKSQDPAVQGENGSAQLMRVMGAITRNGVRTLERAREAIADWNSRCMPPWDDRELEHAFENAIRRVSETAAIQLPMGKGGEVLCFRVHLDRIVREDPAYEFAFAHNERLGGPEFNGEPLTDKHVIDVELDICRRYRLRKLDKTALWDSILSRASDRTYDPVKEYLERLRWDGVERLARVPEEIIHCAPSAIAATFFRRWAIGAVRRALEPGCQMDTVLIIHGVQGLLKSTFFRALGEPWFADTAFDMHDKDSMMQVNGTWIYEWGELNSISKFENERIKGFLSSRSDRFRPPYARTLVERPRNGVIVGTTNRDDFLVDPTGARRFWVLSALNTIDVARARADRDQLWAEAVHLAKRGEPHWLIQRERQEHIESTKAFQYEDPIYWAARNEVGVGPDMVVWGTLCARIGLMGTLSGAARESVTRALKDEGFRPGFTEINGRRARAWVRDKRIDDGS